MDNRAEREPYVTRRKLAGLAKRKFSWRCRVVEAAEKQCAPDIDGLMRKGVSCAGQEMAS